jgi:hypothetical protein
MIEWIGFLVWVALCAALLLDRMSMPKCSTSRLEADALDTTTPFPYAPGTTGLYRPADLRPPTCDQCMALVLQKVEQLSSKHSAPKSTC